MTEYYKVGTTPEYGKPAATTHFGGQARGTVLTVFEPLTAETKLVSEYGQPRTLADLLAVVGRCSVANPNAGTVQAYPKGRW